MENDLLSVVSQEPIETTSSPAGSRSATCNNEDTLTWLTEMDDGLALPWWEYSATALALPGAVVQSDARTDESMVKAFLQAGSRAETAERFMAANSLNITAVLDALSRDELVLPTAQELEAHEDARFLTPTEGAAAGSSTAARPSLRCRSRLLGLPLADRHATLTVACSLGHRLPRRALVNFLCRLVLGDDVAGVQLSLRHCFPGDEEETINRRRRTGISCSCGGQELLGRANSEVITHRAEQFVYSTAAGVVVEPCAACKTCLVRREWLDSFSARLLTSACRKLLWARNLSEDEILALNRCLAALSGALIPPKPEVPWPDAYWEKDACHPDSCKTSATHQDTPKTVYQNLQAIDNPAPHESRREKRRDFSGRNGAARADDSVLKDGRRKSRRGIAAVAARVRERQDDNRARKGNRAVGVSVDLRKHVQSAAGKRPRATAEEQEVTDLSCSQPRPSKVAKGVSHAFPAKRSSPDPANTKEQSAGSEGSTGVPQAQDSTGTGTGRRRNENTNDISAVKVHDEANAGNEVAVGQDTENTSEEGQKKPDGLSTDLCEKLTAVAELVAAASARGATSMNVQAAASAVVALLQAAVSSSAQSAATRRALAQQRSRQRKIQEPLEALCQQLELEVALGKGQSVGGGCRDDLVMAVCNGFVTPALSLRNCLSFVSAVLVPRARSLSGPASRLLVTAVSGIGKARPGAVVDGLILPLLCDADPLELGSAQCELCTRLIKQVLPKHTLEGVLCGLCGVTSHEGSSVAGSRDSNAGADDRKGCIWTELTMPVITAALNLKPPLSDTAIGVLVRRVEAASEQPELQKSLKFTTLVHSLVTRYGPQVKPYVGALRSAIRRCSTFMVKTVLGALQRSEK